jgi:hypothetical protein
MKDDPGAPPKVRVLRREVEKGYRKEKRQIADAFGDKSV